MKKIFLIVLFTFLGGAYIFAQSNQLQLLPSKYPDLALTPPMGWNSWNKFACDIDENLIMAIADAMEINGLKDSGYEYIVIDDCWHGERDSLGFITADPIRFPSGIKALADYVHSKGLKFGIYSDAGSLTCGGRPGSLGHEYQDALTYAKWGVDYLKYDWCSTQNINPIGAYTLMSNALSTAGRPILFSLCEWGDSKPWEWAIEVGHMWRTTGDIYNCFDCIEDYGTWKSYGVLQILDMQDGLRKYAGPGHWNDPDMLQVGNGMKVTEDRAHFSLWAMICSPLMLGNDLRNMSAETLEILNNKEVIAINQDKLGVQALKQSSIDGLETWFKPLENGDWAVCFLNRSKEEKTINVQWDSYTFIDEVTEKSPNFDQTTYKLKNLWTKKEEGDTKKNLKLKIPSYDVVMYRLVKNY